MGDEIEVGQDFGQGGDGVETGRHAFAVDVEKADAGAVGELEAVERAGYGAGIVGELIFADDLHLVGDTVFHAPDCNRLVRRAVVDHLGEGGDVLTVDARRSAFAHSA